MVVCVPNFGEIRARWSFERVVVSMTRKIENKYYSETPPKVAVSKDSLMMKVWRENIPTLSLKFLAG